MVTTVLRWLLSHLLLLIFVALGVTAWLNRDQLQIEAILEDLRAPAAVQQQARRDEADPAHATEPMPASGEANPAGDEGRQAAALQQPPQFDSARVPPTSSDRAASSVGGPEGNRGPDEGGEAAVPQLEQSWYGARQAYWDGDMAEAERRYQELIIENPEKADAYGELGNLYYSQGAWVEAAKMYYQAAVLLIEQGEAERAGTLVGILTALNPNLAEDLQNELDRASRP
jgi:TolA-binding protein